MCGADAVHLVANKRYELNNTAPRHHGLHGLSWNHRRNLFLAAAEKNPQFFYRVFELPLLRNAQKRVKKNERNIRGRKNKTEGKGHIFVDEPRWTFLKKVLANRVSELPLLRNAQKRDKKSR
jgi:hypothetical protein